MNNSTPLKTFGSLYLLFVAMLMQAQDKVYTYDTRIIQAKVLEISPTQIKFVRSDLPSGPSYTMNLRDIDSIVYSNGIKEIFQVRKPRRNYKVNIPQLNTWNFNPVGFAHLSACQAYERRLKNGIVGFRVPLYIGFSLNAIAGFTKFQSFWADQPFSNSYEYERKAFNMATGLNAKIYFFKHRIIRIFAGPEADIGFSIYKNNTYQYNNYYSTQIDTKPHIVGTFAAAATFGLCINPVDKFNITVNGAVGGANVFGKKEDSYWTGVWQIGVSLGTNF